MVFTAVVCTGTPAIALNVVVVLPAELLLYTLLYTGVAVG
jgi:hypothetical protein